VIASLAAVVCGTLVWRGRLVPLALATGLDVGLGIVLPRGSSGIGALLRILPQGDVATAETLVTVGAIALHGIRLAEVRLGETVAVIGLGLIGQLTVQMLKASGCTVLGMDPDASRCRLAEQYGCDATAVEATEFQSLVTSRTNDIGADAVLITAASSSNAPVELAGEIARARAIVVAVGAVGTEIPRKPYYEKELDFRISRSYGPGRYDPEYEERGRDYPISYVRWTESHCRDTGLHSW